MTMLRVTVPIFIFLVSLAMIGGFLGVEEFDEPEPPSIPDPMDLGEVLTETTQIVTFIYGLIPPATGVFWFDSLIRGGIIVSVSLIVLEISIKGASAAAAVIPG